MWPHPLPELLLLAQPWTPSLPGDARQRLSFVQPSNETQTADPSVPWTLTLAQARAARAGPLPGSLALTKLHFQSLLSP